MKKVLITFLMIFALGLFAKDMKLAYINSEKIVAEYVEAKKAKDELAKWNKVKEAEAMKMEQAIKKLEDEVKNMSVMISEEKKKEKMMEGQKQVQAYYQFKESIWGQTGEFYRENQKIMQPILVKINEAIKRISETEGYDFVFDANTGALLFSKPEYDITDLVIKDLNSK